MIKGRLKPLTFKASTPGVMLLLAKCPPSSKPGEVMVKFRAPRV